MKKVIIIGAGGHGKVVADIVRLSGDEVIGFIDDKKPDELPDFNIVGTTVDIGAIDCLYFAAVGNHSIREKLMGFEVKWYTAIHPTAVVAEGVIIGEGTCVMANAVINPGSSLGRGVIVNTSATVDHDCRIGNYVHIAPGVNISGAVSVGSNTWIGVGSAISNGISICSGCVIGAGSVVVKDIKDAGTYVGVPARRISL